MSLNSNLSTEIRPAKRVLTYREEYGIAVYYVCGVKVADICRHFDVHRMTIHRVLTRLGVKTDRRNSTPSD